jgi:hypothetical protein
VEWIVSGFDAEFGRGSFELGSLLLIVSMEFRFSIELDGSECTVAWRVDVSNGDIAKCVSREDRPCQGLTCLLDHGDRLVLEEMISSTELIPDTI